MNTYRVGDLVDIELYRPNGVLLAVAVETVTEVGDVIVTTRRDRRWEYAGTYDLIGPATDLMDALRDYIAPSTSWQPVPSTGDQP